MKVIEFPQKDDVAEKFVEGLGQLIDDAASNGVSVALIIATLEQLKVAMVLGTLEFTEE